jgi:hypothetical protein
MDMQKREEEIYRMPIKKSVKIKLLSDLIVDCINELAAQDQNMHPEIEHNLAAALQTATNHLRKLKSTH